MTEQNNNNPLQDYFRKAELYITLPSKGKYYSAGTIELTATGELPVMPMTAKDEMMFKTPDALLNGQSTVDVIQSCIPAIKNAWEMPSIDVDATLIAIRLATYGNDMEVSFNCPICHHINDYNISLNVYLERYTNYEFTTNSTLSNGMIIEFKPLLYKESSSYALKTFEEQKIFKLVNDDGIPDKEKIRLVNETAKKLALMNINVISDSVKSITINDILVEDKDQILEFILNTDKSTYEELYKVVNNEKDKLKIPDMQLTCGECDHEWEAPVTFDHANFFGRDF